MYIKFKRVVMNNFQAIRSVSIDLDSQNIVIVKGINNFENNASSNGSGKSSLFESILWVIYGKTSSGISDPSNRYINEGCYVNLEFDMDNDNYSITRTVKYKDLGSSVEVVCNGENISRKNKTDTEKLIKEIFNINQDIFQSVVFLSQGFSNRISNLTPSGRKERIELLTGISDKIEDFKVYVTNIKNRVSSNINDINNKISYLDGSEKTLQNNISELIDKINSIGDIDIKFDIDKLNTELSENKINYESLSKLENSISSNISDLNYKINISDNNIKNIELDIKNSKDRLSKLSDSRRCPTCGSILNDEKSQELIDDLTKSIENEKIGLKSETKILNEYNQAIDKYKKELEEISGKLYIYKEAIDSIEEKLSKSSEIKSINIYKDSIKETKLKISEIIDSRNELSKDLEKYEDDFSIISYCLNLISRNFRTYVLGNIIDFMNTKLETYSKMLFSSGEFIKLEINSNKLDIMLKDSSYEALSGGEKRKVDIALTFVQRDLLMNIAGISTNLIILDEVMDHMDMVATESTLNMILEISDHISSIFIISHNSYEIVSDKIITVTKNENRYSTVDLM